MEWGPGRKGRSENIQTNPGSFIELSSFNFTKKIKTD